MRKNVCILLLLLLCSLVHAQQSKPDSSLTVKTVKQQLQGLWSGPDDSYYFLFRGDSVKEWEADGADSSVKPFCIYAVSKVACDSLSAHTTGTTGYFMTVTCPSIDYDESRCYFIQSVNTSDLQLGVKGQFDESGHLRRIKKKDGGY